jgi:hypothetical protein
MYSCGDVYSSILVIGEIDAEFVVDVSLVRGIGAGQALDHLLFIRTQERTFQRRHSSAQRRYRRQT